MNAITITALLLSAGTLFAANPDWKKNLTSTSLGKHPRMPGGTMEFNVSWKNILNSGTLEMEFLPQESKKSNTYIVRSTAVSNGPAAVVFPYKGHSWSELYTHSLKPKLFHSTEHSKGEKITTTSRYFSNRVECREHTVPESKKEKTTTENHTFNEAPVYDIGSAILHIRSQDLKKDDEIKLLIHPFSSPYLMTVKVIGRESHMDQKAIRLSVGMQKIDRKTMKLKNYKKLKKSAILWLSDNDLRVPLEVRAEVFIGDIRATLTQFKKS